MKTIMVRDLRQRWPEAEAALQDARLVRLVPSETKRKPWNPGAHKKWIKKVYGSKVFPGSDELLAAARADRQLI
jgi:hypothetical protein